ncbi:hypothetical protein IWW50_007151, partial [Coemansia erecta]
MYLITGRKRSPGTARRSDSASRDANVTLSDQVSDNNNEDFGDDDHFVDRPLSDADLQDPGLLSELAALRAEMGLPADDDDDDDDDDNARKASGKKPVETLSEQPHAYADAYGDVDD